MHHRKILAAACAICAAGIAALTPCARAFPQSAGADTARVDTSQVIMVWGDTTRAGATGAATAPSAPVIVDGIVATVEDRAIFKSEVDNEIKNFMIQSQRASLPPDEEKALRQEALNSLIATALLTIQADRDNLRIEDKELDAAIDALDRAEKNGDRGGRRVRSAARGGRAHDGRAARAIPR